MRRYQCKTRDDSSMIWTGQITVVNFQIFAQSCKRINLIAHCTDSKLELMPSHKSHKYIQMASVLLSTIRNISYKLELGQGLMKKEGVRVWRIVKLPSDDETLDPDFFWFPFFLDFEDDWPIFWLISARDFGDPSFDSTASDCTKLSVLWKVRRRNITSSDAKRRLIFSSTFS